MDITSELRDKITSYVHSCFKQYVSGKDEYAINYTSHSLEEMDNDDSGSDLLEFCMTEGELISLHWEYPFKSTKVIFLCEPLIFLLFMLYV